MKKNIYKEISKVLNIKTSLLKDETGPGDLPEWDSLGHQNLILALEHKFKLKFNIDEVLEMESVGEIIEIIEEKIKVI